MKSNRATIRYMQEKLKSWLLDDRVFVALLLAVVALGAFALGRLSATELPLGTSGGAAVSMTYTAPNPAVSTTEPPKVTSPATSALPMVEGSGEVVASKSGTKYHLPDCPGAKQIKPENLIRFSSRAAAEAAGYTKAANCKGL